MIGNRRARPLDGLGVGLGVELQDAGDVVGNGDEVAAVFGHRTFLF